MTADYASLEARVHELEQQMRHMLPGKIDAVAYGLSLVHADVTAMREAVDGHTAGLASIERRLDRHAELLTDHGRLLTDQAGTLAEQGRQLTDHGHMLAEILRRLPDPEAG